MTRIRSGLARTGLVAVPLRPHEFESGIHMLYRPPVGPTVASVPNMVTPADSARCARARCDRPRADPIHRIAED
ncbi:MAG TPA: hypothetical protein VFQ75_05140 [Candidatus Limnocylindrales bacterium]|nr:hypothetical protein [Candidatus Limnocylindrales bacterium]